MNITGLIQTVGPSEEPITVADAKLHARVDSDAVDTEFASVIIPSARQAVEMYTDRALITSTWQLTLPGFPPRLWLPKGQAQSITSISYKDTDKNPQTLDPAEYSLATGYSPAWVEPTNQWPTTGNLLDAVSITYVAGWADAASVPEALKMACLFWSTYLWENRGDVMRTSSPYERGILLDMCRPYRLGVEFHAYW